MSKLKMASSRKDSISNANISSSVKAKLHKWIGKASKTVRDKRIAQDVAAEIEHSNPSTDKVPDTLSLQHSRSRSSPVPMPNKENANKKARKWSVNFTPTGTSKEDDDIVRENERNHSYSKNGGQQVSITPSVRLDESSIAPSGGQENYEKETFFDEQTGSAGEETNKLNDTAPINGMNGFKINLEVPGSNARAKRRVLNRSRSKTSIDLSEQEETAVDGRMISAVSLDSIPTNVQELSGQIQTRLQMWVKRASYLAAQCDRRQSEESASSTDEGANTPDSSRPRSPGSENDNQMKKIKELELALKELVGNVGVRVGSVPSKLQEISSNSPGSSSTNRSRKNSDGLGSDQVYEEFNENEKDRMTEKGSGDSRKAKSREARNNSSSSSESDTVIKTADIFDRESKEEDQEDVDGIIFLKSSCSTRHSPINNSPRERKAPNLQDVLIYETLIENTPKNRNNDKKMAPKNLRDEIGLQHTTHEECSSEFEESKARSGKCEVQNPNQNSSKTVLQGTFSLKNGILRKLPARPKLRRHAMSSDSNFMTTNSTVRDSMRQYLNFKDADLSAFAVECVRHANKKKQIAQEDDRTHDGKGNLQGTFVNTKDTTAFPIQQKPIVVISSQDNYEQSVIGKGLGDDPGIVEDAQSSKSPMDSVATEGINASQVSSSDFFSRAAEEAEQILASAPTSKESLGRSSSNLPQDIESNSQRLYKFPSMPMFYSPITSEESEKTQQSKEIRKSVTFPSKLHELAKNEVDSCGHEPERPLATSKRVSSSSNSVLNCTDENGNVTKELRKSPGQRPKIKQRKVSAPSMTLLGMSPPVRVDIEALI